VSRVCGALKAQLARVESRGLRAVVCV